MITDANAKGSAGLSFSANAAINSGCPWLASYKAGSRREPESPGADDGISQGLNCFPRREFFLKQSFRTVQTSQS